MNIDELFDFYHRVSLENDKIELEDTYVRGSTSLTSARQEILHNRIPISPFDMYKIVLYGIVSIVYTKKPSQLKFRKTKKILESGHDAIKSELLNYLQRKSA